MNGYDLSRNWFNFSFENPERVRPIHAAIFFFACEHCNRLGGKEKFGFPSQMTMDAIGVKNYQTYGKALKDLEDWGFIEFVERSRNQYSANIISITAPTENGIARGKALDKATLKHVSKQTRSTASSIVSIDKPLTIEPINQETINHSFERFWNHYNKKEDRKKCFAKWSKLKDKDREAILAHVPRYVTATPDVKFRKNPATYLNNRTWEDEALPSAKAKKSNGVITDFSDMDYFNTKGT